MKPVEIPISSSDIHDLRAQCIRLGISFPVRAAATKLRGKLRAYNQNYMLWLRWNQLAELLFGAEHGIATDTLDAIVDGVHNRLYERLLAEGYVGALTVTRGEVIQDISAFRLITDPKSRETFIVTGKQNSRVVNTQTIVRKGQTVGASSAHSIMWVAKLVFPDVAAVTEAWENEPRRTN